MNIGCGKHYLKEWINLDCAPAFRDVQKHDVSSGLPFKDASVDVVYHSHVLEHLDRNEGFRLIKECHRVLKPDGVLRIVVPDLEEIAREYLRQLEAARRGDEAAALNHEWMTLELVDQLSRHQPGGLMAEYIGQANLPNEAFVISRMGSEYHQVRTYVREDCRGWKHSAFKAAKMFRNRLSILVGITSSAAAVGTFRTSGEVHRMMYDEISLVRILKQVGFREIKRQEARTSWIASWDRDHILDFEAGKVRKPDSLFIEGRK